MSELHESSTKLNKDKVESVEKFRSDVESLKQTHDEEKEKKIIQVIDGYFGTVLEKYIVGNTALIQTLCVVLVT